MPKISNPRKTFLFQVTFVKHPINTYLFQRVVLPEIGLEKVSHGDTNHDIKTAGRATVGDATFDKLETTSGSDTWLTSWLQSAQDMALGGGLTPLEYYETILVNELAEDGTSIINQWVLEGCFPTRLNGQELNRMSSDNTIETFDVSVNTCQKL